MVKRKTTEQFEKEVHEWTAGEYTLVGVYIKSSIPTTIKHNVCGRVFDMAPNKFQQGHRCPACYKDSKVKTLEQFISDVRSIHGELFEVVSDYTSSSSPVTLKCTVHNFTFDSVPNNILRKTKRLICPKCFGDYQREKQRKDTEEVVRQLTMKHRGKIELIGEYVNTHTKTLFKCADCGKEFKAEPNSVLRISGCPYCSTPKGEKLIREFLDDNNIPYESQKKFEGLEADRKLSYDFYLPVNNIVVEYDGLQHDKPIEFFGGVEAYNKQRLHDELKTSFAQQNGITLLRFKYEESTENILNTLSLALDMRKAEHPTG